MLKPDLRTSEKVASWPREVRYFWALSWGYVDDFGKGLDNLLLIRADCFPLDDDLTTEMLDCWLWRWQQDGVLARYTAGGKNLLQIVNWSEHQKPQHPKASDYPDFNARGNVTRTMPAPCMNPACIGHASFSPELSRDELSGSDLPEDREPPRKCPKHQTMDIPPKCGQCADARVAWDAWRLRHYHDPLVPSSVLRAEPTCEHDRPAGTYCDICVGIAVAS
jgi:hypothetical protein